MKIKKILLSVLSFVLILAISVTLAACDGCDGGGGDDEILDEITVTLNKKTLELDERSLPVQLTATVKINGEKVEETVAWSSSNTAVVTVDNGLVTVVDKGEANVICTYQEVSAICTVTVGKYYEPEIKLTLEHKVVEKAFEDGYQMPLSVTAEKSGAAVSGLTYTWKSSDESVATVDNAGVVTFKGEGMCIITVSVVSGQYEVSAKCTFKIGESTGEDDLNDVVTPDPTPNN